MRAPITSFISRPAHAFSCAIVRTEQRLCRRARRSEKPTHGVAQRQTRLYCSSPGSNNHERRPFTAENPMVIPSEDELYKYTRSRFVQDEAEEMAARHVRFDPEALGHAAALAIDARRCVRIEGLRDGMHNKTLLLTMDNGSQVVAKIPFPVAGLPHLTTASEVATMQFMLETLRIPVPKVLGSCSQAAGNPVGAEYVLKEKAPGVSLKSTWSTMLLKDRFAIVKQLADFQSQWSLAPFPGYGSIYYSTDLPPEHSIPIVSSESHAVRDSYYSIGPTTGRDWLDDRRQEVSFDRGPWFLPQQYLEAIGNREKTCVIDLDRLPPTQVTLCGPGTYQSTKEKKLRALRYYLRTLSCLRPSDKALERPSAWHGDLHVENIFVDENDPTRITCLIDWQSTEVAPLFVHARQPYILDHDGPQATGLARPELPKDLIALPLEEQRAAKSTYLAQSLSVAYRRYIETQSPLIWKCFEFQESPNYELLLYARALLVDGEAIFSARIVDHLSEGHMLADSGLTISDTEKMEIKADAEGALRGMKAMIEMQEVMGDLFPERGCVRPDQYDATKDALRQMKTQIIHAFAQTDADRAAWEKSCPFDN